MSIIQGTAHSGAGYNIERSLRFNSADSAYLNRTFGTPTAQKRFTLSLWTKRGAIATAQMFFSAAAGGGSTNPSNCYFNNGDQLVVELATSAGGFQTLTNAVFRDPSAWYHIILSVDLDAASGSRVRWYVNGTQQTVTYNPSEIASGAAVSMNAAVVHRLGTRDTLANYFSGYLTEVNFIDGQALTPSSFGETDPNTGVWRPKKYTGTYGTNGFYLNFADNSGTTSTTLGKDSSGNGNNWTPNNFSVTAGAGNDSLVDTPTPYGSDTGAGGEVRGNYVTMNPLNPATGVTSTLANGNLEATGASGSTGGNARATVTISSGKWYWEVTELASATSSTNFYPFIGCVTGDDALTMRSTSGVPSLSGLNGWSYESDGTVNRLGSGTVASASNTGLTTNDVLGIGLDLDNGNVYFWVNGVAQNSGNAVITGLTGVVHQPAVGLFSSASVAFNFGQRPFAYTAPSGYKALCTTNLPTPTIGATSTTQANDYFNAVLYTGTNSSARTITGVGFQPDFVWVKKRSASQSHFLWDAVRGNNLQLYSDLTDAETNIVTGSAGGGIGSAASDGFNIVAGTLSAVNLNNSDGSTYVAWNWKANGAGSTNTSGTITSTVSANTTAGFSVATFTSQSSGTGTFGHGLGVAPSMVILKLRATTSDWFVYHSSLGATKNVRLNLTDSAYTQTSPFNDTAPTSTLVTLGTAWAGSLSMVAYCFAEVEGYSRAFSYTGNGSTDGPFVFLNFRPRFILTKRSDSADDWNIIDTARSTYNEADAVLFPNLSNAEYTTSDRSRDILSNGFKVRDTNAEVNASGGTYIGFAFAENPFKYSLAR